MNGDHTIVIRFGKISFARAHFVMLRVSERAVRPDEPKTPCIELSLTSRDWYFDFSTVEEAQKAEADLIAKING